MSAIGLLFILIALVGGFAGSAFALTLARRGRVAGADGEQPSWVRFHVR